MTLRERLRELFVVAACCLAVPTTARAQVDTLAAMAPATPSPTISPLPSNRPNWYAQRGAHVGGLDVALVRAGNGDALGDHLDEKWPRETQSYVDNVIGEYDSLQRETLLAAGPTPTPVTRSFVPTDVAFVGDNPSPTATDPCAGRAWSLQHPLRICGRVRIVPGDPIARDLWYGAQLAGLIDYAVSAAGQRALFEPRTLEWSGVLRGVDVVKWCYCSAHYAQPWALRGPTITLNNQLVNVVRSPSAEETDVLLKPFASNFATYLIGGVIVQTGQSLLENGTPGLRPLDTISQRDLLTQAIYAHEQGIASWSGVQRASDEVTQWFDACAAAVQRDMRRDAADGASLALIYTAREDPNKPRLCASFWPSLYWSKTTFTDVEPMPSPEPP